MTNRIMLTALSAALAGPALAQPVTQRAAAVAPAEDLVRVALDTDKGRILLALDRGRAPQTVANFLAYVDGRKLDGESFYRAMRNGAGGLIQGGITSDAAKLRKPVPFESSEATGLHNVAGSIAMAAAAPGQAQSDFFIMTSDFPTFDGANGFAAFGHVIEGMDVVQAILAGPVSATKGEGVMQGQMLEPVVRIKKVERVNA